MSGGKADCSDHGGMHAAATAHGECGCTTARRLASPSYSRRCTDSSFDGGELWMSSPTMVRTEIEPARSWPSDVPVPVINTPSPSRTLRLPDRAGHSLRLSRYAPVSTSCLVDSTGPQLLPGRDEDVVVSEVARLQGQVEPTAAVQLRQRPRNAYADRRPQQQASDTKGAHDRC